MAAKSLDKWREYFCSSNFDIFDVIEHSIMVAAADYKEEFRIRRDRIAEVLFSCKLSKCVGCDHVELLVANEGGGNFEEKKVESDRDVDNQVFVSNYSYRDAEALTDEIEEETQIFGEVLRIKKDIVQNSQDESESLLLDSLRRLEFMPVSVEVLKATEIGKVVNSLRKHAAKDIRQLVRTLIRGWKVMVDEWVTATETIAGGRGTVGDTSESVNPSSVVDEEEGGLPSPPLDDLAFFAQPTPMELSQFFDGLDDDLNPQNSGKFYVKRESGTKPRVESAHNITKQRHQLQTELVTPLKDKKDDQTRIKEASVKQTTLLKPNNSVPVSWPRRPTKPSLHQNIRCEPKLQQKSEKVTTQRPPVSQHIKSMPLDEADVELKLEDTKRKFQECCQQKENGKRQRRPQVAELRDLPKQGLGHKNPHVKPGSNNRNWANGRH